MFKTINTLAIAVSLSLLGFTQAQAGLLAHWKFDEGSGTSVADSSSNSNTGTLTNMTGNEWTTGPVGGALNFDGVDDYVLVSHDSSLNATSALSVAFWIKTTNSQQHVVSKSLAHSGSEADDSFGLRIHSDGAPAIQISNGTDVPMLYSSQAITDGAWHHVAYVFDRPTSKFYIDGAYDGSGSYTSFDYDLHITTEDVYIGASDTVNFSGGPYNFLDGSLDDLRIYDSALTAAQIQALANGVPEPSTLILSLVGLVGCILARSRRRSVRR